MRQTHRSFTSSLALLVMVATLAAGLGGCSAGATPVPFDKVRVQLKFVHQAQFAGMYLALDQGFYAQEHLDVTLIEGKSGTDVVGAVTSGAADLGVGAPEAIILARANGKPVVAIATIFRRSPVVFLSRADSGIRAPSDLLGKSVSVTGTVELELQFRAMMSRLGLDIGRVRLVPHTYDLQPFRDGAFDVWAVYATGAVIRLQQLGYSLNLIWPSDYGVHMVSDTILTSDQLLRDNPLLAARFLRATLRGWEAAIADPQAAVDASLARAREKDPVLQRAMLAASIPLIQTGEDRLGWMRLEDWQHMIDTLSSQGILTSTIDAHDVYTMQVLDLAFGSTP